MLDMMNRGSTTPGTTSPLQPVANGYTALGSQINAQILDGQVAWVVVDGLRVPCIIRGGKPHGPVRVLEDRLLNRLSSTTAFNAAFQNRRLLVSKYLSDVEALRLTCAASSQFGAFTVNDLVVDVDEFCELYSHVKSVLHSSTTAVTGGWIQLNNSVIPYVNAKQGKLLPVSVVENAAGLLGPATHQFLPLTLPTDAQCQYLNELCAGAGLDFTFDMTTSLVDINAVCVITKPTPFVRGLPSHDPFSHAQFIDEGVLGDMSSAAPVQSAGTSVAPLGGGVDARSVGPLTPVSQPAVSTLPPSQTMSQVIGSVVSSQSAPPAPAVAKTPPAPAPAPSAPTVIESVSFRGRTISSLRRPADPATQYVLLEAICRVFFPHQHNVTGFIRAVETLLRIPDVHMTPEEEQQFLRFYKLPTDRLRHDKLISVDTLGKVFPRLEVLFGPDVPPEGQHIGTVLTPADSTASQINTNNNNNGSDEDWKCRDDVEQPRKRRRRNNNVVDVVVID